jgi:hypothetical protein
MGACVVNGIGAGPAETLMPAIIADIFFLHDRGKWNTLYWVIYMGSLMVCATRLKLPVFFSTETVPDDISRSHPSFPEQ